MGLTGWIGDLRETQRNLSELLSANTAEEEAASLEIAQSASRFSRRTRQVVDDKLTFSATLMRAGEVSAATRLLAEVEYEVRNEEIALIETVNEVKVAQAVRRGRITRLRLARSMAVAMLGACLLAFSAIGMAVAGALKERERIEAVAPLQVEGTSRAARPDGSPLSPSARRLMRRLQIGNVNLLLTQDEYRMLKELTGGAVDEDGLSDVVGLLPSALAEKVREMMTLASDTVANSPVSSLEVSPTPSVKKVTRVKKKVAKPAKEETASGQDSSGDTSSGDGTSGSGGGNDGGDSSGNGEEREGDDAGKNEGGESVIPLPGDGL